MSSDQLNLSYPLPINHDRNLTSHPLLAWQHRLYHSLLRPRSFLSSVSLEINYSSCSYPTARNNSSKSIQLFSLSTTFLRNHRDQSTTLSAVIVQRSSLDPAPLSFTTSPISCKQDSQRLDEIMKREDNPISKTQRAICPTHGQGCRRFVRTTHFLSGSTPPLPKA